MLQPPFLFSGTSSHYSLQTVSVSGLALLGAFSQAMNLVYLHQQAVFIPSSISLQYTYLIRIFTMALLAYWLGSGVSLELITLHHAMIFILFLFFSFMGQLLLYMANSLESPSKIMPFGYIGVIAGLLSDIFLFDESFNWLMLLGIALTSIGLLTKTFN